MMWTGRRVRVMDNVGNCYKTICSECREVMNQCSCIGVEKPIDYSICAKCFNAKMSLAKKLNQD